jgi:hypothetical protein
MHNNARGDTVGLAVDVAEPQRKKEEGDWVEAIADVHGGKQR